MNPDGGTDVVYTQLRQFMPLRPQTISGSSFGIYIYPAIQNIGGAWQQVGNAVIDLTPYRPGTQTFGVSGSSLSAVYELISMNTTSGSFIVTSGSVMTIGTLTLANIPATPANNVPICAVRLYALQSSIQENRLSTDLIDMRLQMSTVTSGSGGSGGGISEAPINGLSYIRKDASWAEDMSVNQATITGGSTPPTENDLIAIIGTPDQSARNAYVVSTSGSANLHQYLVMSDGGHYAIIPLARTTPATVTSGSVAITTLIAGGTNSWYGRASVEELPGHILCLVYYHASGHATNDGALHVRFSQTYGSTWTAEDTYIDGSAVANFPMNPSGATGGQDAGEPWLMTAPNGDLLLHMWRVKYNTSLGGTYQSRSTDGGKSWSVSASVHIGNKTNEDSNTFCTDDHFVLNGVIYAGARIYQSSSMATCENILINSTDNGVTWNFVGYISIMANNTQEVGFEYIGNNTIIAIVRSNADTNTYSTYSTNMGVTWAALTDISVTFPNSGRHRVRTRAHLKGLSGWWNDSVLIVNGFTQPTSGTSTPRQNAVWVSIDKGITWSSPFYMEASFADGGYGDMFWDATNKLFSFISYTGTTSDADLKQYKFAMGGI
jgi:hypothetical protein